MVNKDKYIEEKDRYNFILKVLQDNAGWFDPIALHGISNPFDIFREMHKLGLRVDMYALKKELRKRVDVNKIETCFSNTISACKYLGTPIQNLYISHWLKDKVKFADYNGIPVCEIHHKNRVLRWFQNSYLATRIKYNSKDMYEYEVISEKELEDKYEKLA